MVIGDRICEDVLYVFKAAPRGRSRRQHGAHATAPAGAPAPAAPTPVGWRESQRLMRARHRRAGQGRGGFDKGTLALAHIGLNAGRLEASPIAGPAYGPAPLVKSAAPSAKLTRRASIALTIKRQRHKQGAGRIESTSAGDLGGSDENHRDLNRRSDGMSTTSAKVKDALALARSYRYGSPGV